jgi:hypothetical protein
MRAGSTKKMINHHSPIANNYLFFFAGRLCRTSVRKPSHVIVLYMLHRHLNHSDWTLAAVDDVIARGQLNDWISLRNAASAEETIRKRILRICAVHISDPYAQRYHFWNAYVRQSLS